MKTIIALSNSARRRRLHKKAKNLVDGGRISLEPQKLTDEHEAGKLHPKIPSKLPMPAEESSSSDVIFIPGVQATRYSATRAATLNLKRRMDGYDIKVDTLGGEGTVHFNASSTVCVPVGGMVAYVDVVAECLASSHDMAVTNVSLHIDGRESSTIEPSVRPMSPEQTTQFLYKLACNYANTKV